MLNKQSDNVTKRNSYPREMTASHRQRVFHCQRGFQQCKYQNNSCLLQSIQKQTFVQTACKCRFAFYLCSFRITFKKALGFIVVLLVSLNDKVTKTHARCKNPHAVVKVNHPSSFI